MSHVLLLERRRKELFRADQLRESLFSKAMGWFLGCFGRNKERISALQSHGNPHHRNKLPHGYQAFRQKNVGARPLLREDDELKYHAKSEESSCNSSTASYRLQRGNAKQSSFGQVSELQEELVELRRKLAEEAKESQKLREEVKNLRSCGVLLQAPDELRKVPPRATDACRNVETNEVPLAITESKAANLGPTILVNSQKQQKDEHYQVYATFSACQSDVLLHTQHEIHTPKHLSYQQAVCEDSDKESLSSKTCLTKTRENEVDSQAASSLNASSDCASHEKKEEGFSHLDSMMISSENHQGNAVKPSILNSECTEISRTTVFEQETQENHSVAIVQPLSFATQACGFRSFLWRQPLSPVHENDCAFSSEEDSCRQSGSSLSSKKCKYANEDFSGIERKPQASEHSDYQTNFDHTSGLSGTFTLPEQPCYNEERTIMLSTSEYCDVSSFENVACNEIIIPLVDSEACDDDEFDIAPIQCLSPQISPRCKKNLRQNRFTKEEIIKKLSALPISSTLPTDGVGKENQAAKDMYFHTSGNHNVAVSKEQLTSDKADSVEVKSAISVLKPVENLLQWKELKQISTELTNQTNSLHGHHRECLHLRKEFVDKDAEFFNHPKFLDDKHLVKEQQFSWDTGINNFNHDESGKIDRKLLACLSLKKADGRYSGEYSVGSNCPDYDSMPSQLSDETEDSSLPGMLENPNAVGKAEERNSHSQELESVLQVNKESGKLEISHLSAEFAVLAPPYLTWKHKHLQQSLINSPTDRPILGTVAAHWVFPTSAEPQKWWDGKGIPNSTTKYKEDQHVSWHTTPFEIRLERALATDVEVPQRNLFRGTVSALDI